MKKALVLMVGMILCESVHAIEVPIYMTKPPQSSVSKLALTGSIASVVAAIAIGAAGVAKSKSAVSQSQMKSADKIEGTAFFCGAVSGVLMAVAAFTF